MHQLSVIFSAFRYFFLFKEPCFEHLDFIDLVIDDKPIFMVAWQLKWASTVRIRPVTKSYRKKEGSVLLHVPHNIQSVEIIASNFWRKKRKTVYFKHTRLDDAAARFLIKHFKPLTTVPAKRKVISLRDKLSSVKKAIIHVKVLSIHSKKTISLKSQKFKYP
jgi:hypothetical protein